MLLMPGVLKGRACPCHPVQLHPWDAPAQLLLLLSSLFLPPPFSILVFSVFFLSLFT